jgi:hypothetical protein
METHEIVQSIIAFSIRYAGFSMIFYGILNNLLYVIESFAKYSPIPSHDKWVLFKFMVELIVGILFIVDPNKFAQQFTKGIFNWENNSKDDKALTK